MESLTGVVWSGWSPEWISVWESLAIRVRREHEIVGSNPTMLTGWVDFVVWSNGKTAHC